MSQPFLAQIVLFGGNFAPRDWAFCDGQLVPINQNQSLFSLLGTQYGGDGRTTFALPDLRGRVAIGPRTGPGLSTFREGDRGGTETNTLTVQQLPAHTHAANAVVGPGDTNVAAGNFWSKDFGTQSGTYNSGPADGAMNAGAIGAAGGGQSINNREPYLAVNWIIALRGVFPSRN